MRLFVSVDLGGLGKEIGRLQAPLAELSGLRLTDSADAHVTMKFLGDGDHDLDALSGAIDAAIDEADVGAFEATFDRVGAFPSTAYIRVVWLGVGRGAEPLTALHRRLEAETTALGYDAESHEFTPHVTLARMEHAAAKADVQAFLREDPPEVGPVHIDELRLKESTLTGDTPTYRTVARFGL
ncbi:MAG: RNA 2',3'-cyclic phosphodiesterase [Natronomonas sp.]|uniref:RNA 2',3'-cyclic phosphodiesterase n=1 Tax=Natronomonas sp. TaxID=2184060 RepID=UPI0028702A8F|nr:RNA 2',3'-cyclic phosphodiesterase [Natronomonas sp.]MDR9430050.1 RNA 2',3'-cyclic phosphodiesterase [Natronomonas sp.]